MDQVSNKGDRGLTLRPSDGRLLAQRASVYALMARRAAQARRDVETEREPEE